ncbi:MAG: hypothetical protein GY765_29650, partial [bacterium]|nr:hypothetical protein [bacterium]
MFRQLNGAGTQPASHNGETRPNEKSAYASEQNADQGFVNNVAEEQKKVEQSGDTDKSRQTGEDNPNDGQLSEEEQRELQELKETDRRVRAHEMAHLSAAGGIAISGANFTYQRGPDGANYAVSGEVSIDTSKESEPEQTISKAEKIASAATAPADPSAQDRKVASSAQAMEADARMELAREQAQSTESADKSDKTETSGAPAATDETEKTGAAAPADETEKTGIAATPDEAQKFGTTIPVDEAAETSPVENVSELQKT